MQINYYSINVGGFFMLLKLKGRIIGRHGTLISGAKVVGMSQARLSLILHEHVAATPQERSRLIAAFGRGALRSSIRTADESAAEVAHG